MSKNRRDFFRNALAGAGLLAGTEALAAAPDRLRLHGHEVSSQRAHDDSMPAAYAAVQTPDIPDLPWTMDNGVKVFHLVAEPVKRKIHPEKTLDLWGYNGTSPGPTIQAMQGDRVRIIVDNHLPESTSMHWHGLEIPIDMDGMPGVSQEPIPPGARFVYEFTLHQEGTYFYHSHLAMQEMMGMLGAIILHPQKPYRPRADKDFVIMLQEYAVLPNNTVPNTMNMEFNWLVFNGKAGPACTPLIVRLGERVRIRMINLGMDHHPIHLHGSTFYVTGTEAGRAPDSTWRPENTVLVAVAQARDIEFDAKYPGDWMLHCHLPHHMMNQMSSGVGPMTRAHGSMPAGLAMEEGMGMLTGTPGAPLGEDYGPGLGRALGVGSTNDQPRSNGPLSAMKDQRLMQHSEGKHGSMQMPGMNAQPEVSPNANSVPGFPQDAFMEGLHMAMDEAVWKPENYGLRPGWSGFMQGMMTFVRVLPPAEYDKVTALISENRLQTVPYTPAGFNNHSFGHNNSHAGRME
ncbi:MAG: copper oxidase [Acidobacteriota bacterium]|nr:copper oxidase [Acidobacteriota bacterium]